jgi:hypothetical protein
MVIVKVFCLDLVLSRSHQELSRTALYIFPLLISHPYRSNIYRRRNLPQIQIVEEEEEEEEDGVAKEERENTEPFFSFSFLL